MQPTLLRSLFLAFSALGGIGSLPAADAPTVQFPAPSPAATLQQRVGLTDITVEYSRPGVKGRKIYGGLVAFGEIWRTGANASTKLVFSTPVKLNGTDIPAGTYALFTIPGEKEWTIIINKGGDPWGAFTHDEKLDVARVKVAPVALAESIETFTIDLNDLRDESATLSITWEKTRVPIKLEVDLTSKLVPQIAAVMASNSERKPYFQAASFYLEHGLDMKQAREWIDAAVVAQPRHFVIHVQAKILARLGEKNPAIAAARRSIELAREANDASYVRLNEDLIASLR